MKRILLVLILLNLATHSFAQMRYQTQSINIAKHTNTYTKVPAPSIYLNRDLINSSPTSQFTVVFDAAVPENAKAAINEAAKIWSYIIDTGYPNNTSQPAITIQVKWEDLKDNNVNAVTNNPEKYINFITEGIKQNVIYPVTLANKLSQHDQNGSNPEITITFNKTQPWYYGIDGNTPTDKTDLMTVMMHEIIHGLGFTGSFQVSSDGTGSWGEVIGTQKYPWIFDCYVANNYQNSVVDNPSVYGNPSTDLGAFLKGGNVFFNGSNAMRMTGSSNLPRLYGPSEWSSGSSTYHLDEDTYPAGSSNSLMTPGTGYAEAIHSPGEIVISALMDMGWDVNRLFTITSPKAGIAWQFGTTQTIKWTDNKFGYISIELVDMSNNVIKNLTSTTSVNSNQGTLNEFTWNIPSDIPASTYRIRMHDMGNDYGFSDPFQISSQGQCLPVAISPGTNQYSDPITVTMQSPEQGVTIRYTMDGSTPTSNSTQYTSSFTLNADATIKASAFKSGYKESLPTVVTYSFSSYAHINVTYRDENNNNYDNDINYWSLWVNGQWKSTWSGWRPIAISPADNIYIKVDARYITDTKKFYSIKNDGGLVKYDNYSTYAALNPTGKGTYQKQYIATFMSAKKATIQNVFEDPGITVSPQDNSVEFADPWLYDKTDEKGSYNSSLNPSFAPRKVPFTVDTDINTENGKLYKGVFLNQGGNILSQIKMPYYSISAKPFYDLTLPQTGKTHRFYFSNWSATGALVNFSSLTTPVIFQQTDASVTANYKGHLLSTTLNATGGSGSQRKIAKDLGGKLHMVYESVGKVWYTTSTDGGATWSAEQLVSGTGTATSPSIASSEEVYPFNDVFCVWQETSGSTRNLYIKSLQNPGEPLLLDSDASTVDLQPSIGVSSDDYGVLVAYKKMYSGRYQMHYKYSEDCGNSFYYGGPVSISTPIMDNNPSIAWNPDLWKFMVSATRSSGSVQVNLYSFDYYGTSWDMVANVYSSSQIPLAPVYSQVAVDGAGRTHISWIAYDDYYGNNSASFHRSYKNGVFSGISTFRDEAIYEPSIVYTTVSGHENINNTNPDGGVSIFYSPAELVGLYNMVSTNGTSWNGITYITPSAPIKYPNSLEKAPAGSVTYVVSKGSAMPYQVAMQTVNNTRSGLSYELKSSSENVTASQGMENVKTFRRIEIIDTTNKTPGRLVVQMGNFKGSSLSFYNPDSLNKKGTPLFSFMRTEGFTFDKDASFSTNLRVKKTGWNGDLKLRLELVEEGSEKILQKVYEGSLGKMDSTSEEKTLKVANRLGKLKAYLRVSVDGIGKENLIVNNMDVYLLNSGKGKAEKPEKELVESETAPVEYALSQNYPNPFNPSTVINYEIPKTSRVTLKIFDMLGKEVTTLVNEYKEQGRYSVEFNASNLPSGTYIYELRANDFVKSGKMMLLK
ncbi:MAG: T9SS type A sorting domain-containing protein [Ignavibacteria bacterium]|jgi:hypothetical protein|nr:T9SS type A sorting domain-containing protein [Ignavibacteria bacterium]MCU7519572.1 T9SS type A sorting domain-containing protein [Ignavibacteria bacterium]